MKVIVFDTESDGLLDQATKLHVMSWTEDGKPQSTNNYDKMREVLVNADKLVCHNAVRHDMPLLNKLLGLDLKYPQFVDTLILSWYINYDRPKHGLATFGNKPEVTDWKGLSYEEYKNRCEEDCKINWDLWRDLRRKLTLLYGAEGIWRPIEYLSFKMDCAREQEQLRWKLDVPRASIHYAKLCRLSQEKNEQLAKVMPKNKLYKTVSKPKVMTKKDGSFTAAAIRWRRYLRNNGKPMDHEEPFKVIRGYERGNPTSVPQLKEWLFSLGWEPRTFKYVKDEREESGERAIPQIRYPKNHPRDGDLCDSVMALAEKEPKIEVLQGYTVINHRKGFFKRLLDSEEGGYIKAQIDGLTNTWRFKHKKPLANIPKVGTPWGEEIRGCLTVENGGLLAGADMSSLESTTKRHYMQPIDPEYVEEMSKDDFDEHLDLAYRAGYITKDDLRLYNDPNSKGTERYKQIAKIRTTFKPVNYGSIYGIGPPRLAREMGITYKKASEMINAYWARNWAIKKLVEKLRTKQMGGSLWLYNPVSKFWHQLRYTKDKFSTLNQSTGVYCFDMWTMEIRKQGVQFCGQFHDEHIAPVKKGDEKKQEKIYLEALDKTNQALMLNVPLGMEAKYGRTYAEIH